MAGGGGEVRDDGAHAGDDAAVEYEGVGIGEEVYYLRNAHSDMIDYRWFLFPKL